MPALISCTTLPQVEKPKLDVPDPIVNNESVVYYVPDKDEVAMPSWYWKKVVRYIIDSQALLSE